MGGHFLRTVACAREYVKQNIIFRIGRPSADDEAFADEMTDYLV